MDEIEIELPEIRKRRRSPDFLTDADKSAAVRALLHRAIRHGRISLTGIAAITGSGQDDSAEGLQNSGLVRVLHAMGVQIDDAGFPGHPELNDLSDDAEQEDDSFAEEVDDACELLSSIEAQIGDSLRLYARDMGPKVLLSRDEEAGIGRSIELASERAAEAIASSVQAIREVLRSAEKVQRGDMPLEAMVTVRSDASAEDDADDITEVVAAATAAGDADGEENNVAGPEHGMDNFRMHVTSLQRLVCGSGTGCATVPANAARIHLSAL